MLVPVPQREFGGLVLVDQASQIDSSAALDLADVQFGASGEVGTRAGTQVLSTFDESAAYDSMLYSNVGGGKVLSSAGARVRAVDVASGASSATATPSADQPYSWCSFGAPTTERVYGANGEHLVYYTGGGGFTVDGTVVHDTVAGRACPRPRCVAIFPAGNRLLACGYKDAAHGPNGALGSPHTLFYSEQGDPATWKTTWRETLTPGDGEYIAAAISWRDKLFVFKQSRYFVFYAASSDGSGNPQLEYYPVEAGCGVRNQRQVVAARDGVYFADRKGVYRTIGEEPELVSLSLDPLFHGRPTPFFTGEPLDASQYDSMSICAAAERIFVGYPTSGGRRSLMFDPRFGWWSYYRIPLVCGTAAVHSGRERLVYGDGSVRARVVREGSVGDDGVMFPSHWRSSWLSFGQQSEQILQRIRAWGTGMVAVSGSVDFGPPASGDQLDFRGVVDTWGGGGGPDTWGDGLSDADVWATGGAYRDDWVHWSWRGELFSLELRSVGNLPWSVQRLENHVQRPERVSTDTRANA